MLQIGVGFSPPSADRTLPAGNSDPGAERTASPPVVSAVQDSWNDTGVPDHELRLPWSQHSGDTPKSALPKEVVVVDVPDEIRFFWSKHAEEEVDSGKALFAHGKHCAREIDPGEHSSKPVAFRLQARASDIRHQPY